MAITIIEDADAEKSKMALRRIRTDKQIIKESLKKHLEKVQRLRLQLQAAEKEERIILDL